MHASVKKVIDIAEEATKKIKAQQKIFSQMNNQTVL